MFSPIVSLPLTHRLATGQKALYCAASRSVAARNFALVSALHQLRTLPVSSNSRPWSSKPWPISWPITAPMAP